jgi:glycosyltransferase involved in cell wall biosynthesis
MKSTSYGLAFVTSSSMIQYALEIDPAVPLVVDFGEVESEWWLRQSERGGFPGPRFFHTEAKRLRLAEATSARRAVRCFAATDAAAAAVRTLAPEAAVTVLPNGLDLEYFGNAMQAGGGPLIVFNGSLGSDEELHDLREFCRRVLPLITARVPGARLVVTGRERPPAGRVPTPPDAEVVATGVDVRRYFHAQAVAVAPLRAATDARGLVLEPMAASVPVVATSKACEQLGARASVDLAVSDDAGEFAQHVVRLLGSGEERRGLGDRGRRFVETHFSWECYGAQLAEAIAGVMGSGERPAAPRPADPVATAETR